MMNAAAMAILVDKGLSSQDILDLMMAMESRSSGADRQARYRDRQDCTASEWEVIRRSIFERDGYSCVYCGSGEQLACDHILPLIRGGTSAPNNLATACKKCNSGKSGKTVAEWAGE